MSSRFVRQPNGKIAVFSDTDASFEHVNHTVDSLRRVFPSAFVEREAEVLENGGTISFDDAMATMRKNHGIMWVAHVRTLVEKKRSAKPQRLMVVPR